MGKVVPNTTKRMRGREAYSEECSTTCATKFYFLLVVRHLFLVANLVPTSKALVTTSDALVPI